MTFYARDLARVHDEGYGDFARAGAEALLELIEPPGLVVELGCGTGISSAVLAEAGFDIAGVDASEEMLAIARKRVPGATFVQQSAWEFDIPPCRAVTAFGEVLNYTNAGSGDLGRICARAHHSLEPEGLFLFDVATVGRGSGTHHQDGPGWSVDSESVEDGRTFVRRIELTIDGRHSEETHVLHLYERAEIEQCLEGLGFVTETLEGYGDFGFWPGYAGYAARRS